MKSPYGKYIGFLRSARRKPWIFNYNDKQYRVVFAFETRDDAIGFRDMWLADKGIELTERKQYRFPKVDKKTHAPVGVFWRTDMGQWYASVHYVDTQGKKQQVDGPDRDDMDQAVEDRNALVAQYIKVAA